ncbi:Gldg family protein [Chakrabartyella piscis]|uniref:Gldg family protein n=1 Tax=Chakrabartyella piscis TaxID=2918914 RepID=UPI0029585A45|nr:Gldg family protein [Chakrabartyella piscis]
MNKRKREFKIISFLMSVLLLGIVVLSTNISEKLAWNYDMTLDQVFTLSIQSEGIMDELEEEIKITAVYPDGSEDKMISTLLSEYDKYSENIVVSYIDIERNPASLASLNLENAQAVSNGTIVVQSSTREKILTDSSMYTSADSGNAFSGERLITGAITYVTTDEMPVVYITSGHSEADTTNEFLGAVQALELAAYDVQELNLLQKGEVPADAAAVIIPSPKKDLSLDEYNALLDYFNGGGKAMFLFDAMSTNTLVLENFNNLLNLYGVDIHNNFVVEEDSDHYTGNNNMYLIPGYVYHSITENLAEDRNYVVLPIAMGLQSVSYDETECRVDYLLLSSTNSWMRTDVTIEATSKTDADVDGSIPLAAGIVKSNAKYGATDTKIVVIGNSSFVYTSNIEAQGNRDFFISCANWLAGGSETSSTISSKIINADVFIVRGSDFARLSILCVVVLPLIAFIGAFMVWIFRRNQ